MKVLAIITARGGSKRIPKKNIKVFLGKPIIQYSIEAALESQIFNEVMVSTDDGEIASIARQFGASVPFFRSQEASNDFATTAQVIEEVLLEYQKQDKYFDYCCCIYPTAPFITSKVLETAFTLLQEKNANSVIPVVQFSFPILRSLKINEQGLLNYNWPQYATTRSQDLKPAYHDCGQFYFLNCKSFLSTKMLFNDKTLPLLMSENQVQDIDTIEDWEIAEYKFSHFNKSL